jgi:hypothetical protein
VKYFEDLHRKVFGSKNDSAATYGISLIHSDEWNLYSIVPEKSKIEGILSTGLILRMCAAKVAIARFQWQQTSVHVAAGYIGLKYSCTQNDEQF